MIRALNRIEYAGPLSIERARKTFALSDHADWGELTGTIAENEAVAREISTACFCSTRSISAWAPGRGSFAGSTYAAGPSVRDLRIDRLLFS